MVIRTTYLNKLKKMKDKQIIKVVTGVRRCGKSTLLMQFQEYLKTCDVFRYLFCYLVTFYIFLSYYELFSRFI